MNLVYDPLVSLYCTFALCIKFVHWQKVPIIWQNTLVMSGCSLSWLFLLAIELTDGLWTLMDATLVSVQFWLSLELLNLLLQLCRYPSDILVSLCIHCVWHCYLILTSALAFAPNLYLLLLTLIQVLLTLAIFFLFIGILRFSVSMVVVGRKRDRGGMLVVAEVKFSMAMIQWIVTTMPKRRCGARR